MFWYFALEFIVCEILVLLFRIAYVIQHNRYAYQPKNYILCITDGFHMCYLQHLFTTALLILKHIFIMSKFANVSEA